MRKTKYAVHLSEEERAHLRTLLGSGVAPARILHRNQDAAGKVVS
jgi:hypothetical protein